MKLNKTLVLTALTAGSIVAGGSAFGGDGTSTLSSMTTNATSKVSHMFSSGSVDKLSQKLGLTDEQKQKVQSLFDSERQKMSDARKDTSLTTAERRSKLSDIRNKMNTKLQSILTPQQYAKWEDLTHQHSTMSGGSPP